MGVNVLPLRSTYHASCHGKVGALSGILSNPKGAAAGARSDVTAV